MENSLTPGVTADHNDKTQKISFDKIDILANYFKELDEQEIDDAVEIIQEYLNNERHVGSDCDTDSILDEINEDEIQDDLVTTSYSEYFLRKKHLLRNYSIFTDSTDKNGPFDFNIPASVNKVAKKLNQQVRVASKKKQNQNPFDKVLKRDTSLYIKGTTSK